LDVIIPKKSSLPIWSPIYSPITAIGNYDDEDDEYTTPLDSLCPSPAYVRAESPFDREDSASPIPPPYSPIRVEEEAYEYTTPEDPKRRLFEAYDEIETDDDRVYSLAKKPRM
jgi:hypothetical protein